MAAKKKTADEKTKPGSPSTIREEAEKKLKGSPAIPPELIGHDMERTIYELRVHQIELNMQAEELRRSHIELEDSRDKFLDQYDFAPTGLLTINEKGSIIEVNLTCSKLLGVERSKLVRTRFSKFVVPEDQDQYYWYITNVLQQEEKQYCTLMLKPAGGSAFPARLEGVRLSGDINLNPEIRIAISDITEIWQAEEALKKSEEHYRLLTDNAVSAVAVHEIVLDRKGKPVDSVFRSANPAFKTHTGLRAEDVIGHRITELMPGIEKTPFLGICGKVVLTGEPTTFEQYSETLSRHYYVNAFKIGKGRFATVFIDITERKRTEEALRLTQLRLDSAMQAGNIAWWEMDWKTGNVIFEKRKAQMLGYPVEQFSHYSDFTQLVHPDDYQPIMQAMRDLISGINKQYEVDYRIRTRDGEYLWFHDIGTISDYASDGSPSKVTGLVINITGRKRAEVQLQESEEKYRILVEKAKEGIIIAQDGVFAFANGRMDEIFGVPAGDLVGRPFKDFIWPEDRELVISNYRKRISGEDVSETYDFRVIDAEGRIIWVSISAALIQWKGKPATLNMLTDISQRKLAETKLIESKARFDELAEQNNTVVWEVDAKGLITYVSHVSEAVWGYRPDELIGHLHFYDLHPKPGRKAFKAASFAVFKQKEPFLNLENKIQTKDGREVWVSTNGIPLLNADGTLRGYRGSDTDVTRRKNTEEDLRTHQIELEIQADELKKSKFAVEESRDKFLELYDFAPNGYLTLSDKGQIVEVNLTCSTLLGVERSELVNARFSKYIVEKDVEVWHWYFINVLNQDEKKSCTIRLTRSDGSTFPARLESKLIQGINNKTPTVRVAISDITEIQQAEEKLKQSESLLRSMIESPQSIMIFSLDRNFRYLGFNSSHQQTIKAIWGVDIRPGMNMLAVISIESDRKKAEQNFKRALSGEHFTLTEEYGDSALNRKFYEDTYSPIYDENHHVTGLTVYVIDVTERKNSEAALRESDERYRTLFDQNSDLIFVADPKTRMIIDCNRKAEQLTGYSRSELLAQRVDALHPEDVRSATLDNFMKISEGMDISVDSILTTRDGRRVPVLITGGEVVVNGQTLLLGSFRDMTRQKQAEEALQNAHDTLEITVKKRTADLYLTNMQLQKEIEDRKVIAESLKEYAKITSILNEVILTANKAESLPELFRDTLDKALELLDFEGGGIYLVNPAERTAEIHYSKNLPDDFVEKLRKVPIEATPYDTLFVRNQPIITENYDEMSPEEAQKYNIRSLASIPLVSKNTVIGALNVTSSKRYTVSADEKQVLITIGRELGTIVERLRAEEAFKKASENLQVLFDSVNEMIFVLDMQGRIFKVNKTVERKLGYTDEELHNTDVLLLHVPDRRDEALMNVQGMIAGNIDSCPVPLIAKNKKIIEVETKVTRGRWDGNEVLIGVSRDVTERKVAEDEIQRQASLIKSLLDSIPDIIFFKDREGVYLGCNPPFAEFVGKPREDIILSLIHI